MPDGDDSGPVVEPLTPAEHPAEPMLPALEHPAPEHPAPEEAEPQAESMPPAPSPEEDFAPQELAAVLPTCTGSIIGSFTKTSMNHTKSGSNAYVVPGTGRLTSLNNSITSLLAGDLEAAVSSAGAAEYTLCRGTGAESDLVLWRPRPGEGQAWFAYRTGPARAAIFEAPHPLHDSGTLEQAVYLFERLKARVLIASGTHRCASTQKSGCSGTTSVCGSKENYRISDMAHTEQSAFHAAHVAFSEYFTRDWVLSMHGMSASGASISNGTKASTTPDSPSARVALAYAEHFSGVTTCNSFSGLTKRDHMCGTSSPQGRHLNGSANACTSSVKSASGRFIHVEQTKSIRNAMAEVADALDSVLP